jgi:hypothetical protein
MTEVWPRLPRRNRPPISGPPERCQSGRSGRSRKPLCVQAYRGFESHPLRHFMPKNQVTARFLRRRPFSTRHLTHHLALAGAFLRGPPVACRRSTASPGFPQFPLPHRLSVEAGGRVGLRSTPAPLPGILAHRYSGPKMGFRPFRPFRRSLLQPSGQASPASAAPDVRLEAAEWGFARFPRFPRADAKPW